MSPTELHQLTHTVHGVCPTAWEPMLARDGWLLRLRPRFAEFSLWQWQRLAELALRHAHSDIELTRRGNLQLRGISDHELAPLREALMQAQLMPSEPAHDAMPALLCSPFYRVGDPVHLLAQTLADAASQRLTPSALVATEGSALPSKFGFVIDGPARYFQQVSADLHLWVSHAQKFVVSVDDGTGQVFNTPEAAVEAAVAAATWFAGIARTAAHARRLPHVSQLAKSALSWHDVSAMTRHQPLPAIGKQGDFGMLLGAPLGKVNAGALLDLIKACAPTCTLRVTPWRALLISEKPRFAGSSSKHWIVSPDDARLRVSACTGAPRCTQAWAATQPLALQLAGITPIGKHVHVSGCSKRCAAPQSADWSLCAAQDSGGKTPASSSWTLHHIDGTSQPMGDGGAFDFPLFQRAVHEPHL